MEYSGTIRNGVVVLESGVALPDGTAVRVTAVPVPSAPTSDAKAPNGTLAERLLRFAGGLKGLPSDLARNHDHYIHGTPRE